jgi:hypothetical protein
MPPHLSKRQQRVQDKLEALTGPSGVNESSECSDQEPNNLKSNIAKGAIGFAAVSMQTQCQQ